VLVPAGDPTLMPYIRLAAGEFMKAHPGVQITVEPVPFGQMVQTALTALQNPTRRCRPSSSGNTAST
jgi:Bacterial extracellular solute-binding protein.